MSLLNFVALDLDDHDLEMVIDIVRHWCNDHGDATLIMAGIFFAYERTD
ncbi:hypothetical protein JNB88_07705 [Rhizobium cauense]|nr:hypothetical protein [Rhizobium cauense]MBW9113525.1 hypothetical protein [Rhizobium cauense]